MASATMANVAKYFGSKWRREGARCESYRLLERIAEATPTAGSIPNTEAAVKLLLAELASLSDQDFAFLLTHSGFIPDHYGDDSSEETLYTKLIEVLLFEWGRRLGFDRRLPTAKSSTEDVTFKLREEVVVADGKSFRLGRSQGAPNTKDALKPEDFTKWLGRHTGFKTLGGLVGFPSLFDWRRESDVYLYASNSKDGKRILLLFYEHLAYILLKQGSLAAGGFFEILRRYPTLFPAASKNRNAYWLAIDEAVQSICQSDDLHVFLAAASVVVNECARKAADRIEARIKAVEEEEAQTGGVPGCGPPEGDAHRVGSRSQNGGRPPTP